MLASLETLAALPCAGRRFAVLGDMAELGRHAEAAHRETGRRAAELGLQGLWAVGSMAEATAAAARAAGMAGARAFQDVALAAQDLKQTVRGGDLVLVKASRAARLEQVAEILGSENLINQTMP
jgi:UDP-N-acetylmuramyl pentapeptide synthase